MAHTTHFHVLDVPAWTRSWSKDELIGLLVFLYILAVIVTFD